MSAFTSFLKELVAGDNVKDYQHASRIFRDNTLALAPKHSFLFFVVFEINPQITQYYSMLPEYGVLVKSAELPGVSIDTSTLNQYGKTAIAQTGVQFNPIQLMMHDDNSNTILGLWQNYYSHYYANSVNKSSQATTGPGDSPVYRYSNVYDMTQYGYHLNSSVQFFNNIKLYSLHQKQFTEYTLVSPVITSCKHGAHNYDEGGGTMEHTMDLAYENVIYKSGYVTRDGTPRGFTVHYDNSPSALANNTTSIFGPGGLADSASGIMRDLGNGNVLGAVFKGAMAADNFKGTKLKDVFKEEALGIAKGIFTGQRSGTLFPRVQSAPAATPPFNPNANVGVSSNGLPVRNLGQQ